MHSLLFICGNSVANNERVGARKPSEGTDKFGLNWPTNNNMNEFWEEAFKEKQKMWGSVPAKSTLLANTFFVKNKIKTVLIPGIHNK